MQDTITQLGVIPTTAWGPLCVSQLGCEVICCGKTCMYVLLQMETEVCLRGQIFAHCVVPPPEVRGRWTSPFVNRTGEWEFSTISADCRFNFFSQRMTQQDKREQRDTRYFNRPEGANGRPENPGKAGSHRCDESANISKGRNHSVKRPVISHRTQRACSDVPKWQECVCGRRGGGEKWGWHRRRWAVNDLRNSPSHTHTQTRAPTQPSVPSWLEGLPSRRSAASLQWLAMQAFLFDRCTVTLSPAGWSQLSPSAPPSSPAAAPSRQIQDTRVEHPSAKLVSLWRERADWAVGHMYPVLEEEG